MTRAPHRRLDLHGQLELRAPTLLRNDAGTLILAQHERNELVPRHRAWAKCYKKHMREAQSAPIYLPSQLASMRMNSRSSVAPLLSVTLQNVSTNLLQFKR